MESDCLHTVSSKGPGLKHTVHLDDGTTLTFNEVRQVVLLHVFGGVVETDVIHLRGKKVPAVHRGPQQGVDARRPRA